MMSTIRLFAGCALLCLASSANAKWTEVEPAKTVVANRTMSVTAPPHWNRWSEKPIKKEEFWSFDGPRLNKIEFFGAIADGEPLAKETNRKREPLPKFSAAMRTSDVVDLLERTTRIVEGAPDFQVDAVEPASFAGKKGFRIAYHFTAGDLAERGEARGAIIDGKLYLIKYTAPALYYFEANQTPAMQIMESASIN
jgi:hypothetical protein